jgi:DinB superfamily
MNASTWLLLGIMLLSSCSSAWAQTASNQPGEALRTLSQIGDNSVRIVERALVRAADAMPEGRYSFAPTDGEFKSVRSFALQVKHVAASNYGMAAAILNEEPPIDLRSEYTSDSIKSKADIIRFLQDSFGYLHKAVSSINETNATRQVPNPEGPGTVPKLDIAIRQLWHDMDHYGQMVVYLRMNGIIPPASRPRQ